MAECGHWGATYTQPLLYGAEINTRRGTVAQFVARFGLVGSALVTGFLSAWSSLLFPFFARFIPVLDASTSPVVRVLSP